MDEPTLVVRREVYDSQHTLTWGTDAAKTTAYARCSCIRFLGMATLDSRSACLGLSERADAHISDALGKEPGAWLTL